MATVIMADVKHTVARTLLTSLNKWNRVKPTKNKKICEKRLLTIAARNKDSEATMLAAVAAASPTTITLDLT
jgi:hypothetical protein